MLEQSHKHMLTQMQTQSHSLTNTLNHTLSLISPLSEWDWIVERVSNRHSKSER